MAAKVNTQHADYKSHADQWKRCRDVSSGQDAVHQAGEAYLKKLKDQSQQDYDGYKGRATFYNATWRTIVGLSGMIFRKPPTVEVPAGINDYLDDINMAGESLHMLAQDIVEDCLEVGRVGILVDYPALDTEGQTITVAQAQSMGMRPSLLKYDAENIINWRTARVNNAETLVLVVLQENVDELDGEFVVEQETRYRVLDLTAEGYRVRVFEIEDDKDVLMEEHIPQMNGKPLPFIPFLFIGTDDVTPDVDEPPLLDLVNINLSHYRTTADYEHACHFVGLPTPYIAGYSPETEGEKLYLGSSTAWVFPDPATKVGFLELGGNGIPVLENNLLSKEKQMAILGARMLEVQKRGVESADTASIHRKGEESVLSAISQSISIGITKALGWFAQWAGADGEVKFELNRDFYPAQMTDAMLTALIAGWQSGAYSYSTLFENLKQGEIIALETTEEEEQAKIANSPPIMNSAVAPAAVSAAASA